MDRASAKRQLAALLLSLLALVAFSGSVLADCMAAPVEMADSDCHEAMGPDCAHHAADTACMEAADCGLAEPVFVSGERKKAQDQKPDLLLLPEATGPPDSQRAAPEARHFSSRIPDSRTLYLSCCRFLE